MAIDENGGLCRVGRVELGNWEKITYFMALEVVCVCVCAWGSVGFAGKILLFIVSNLNYFDLKLEVGGTYCR